MKTGLLVLAFSAALLASDKPPAGEIENPRALAVVGSYCVDTTDLSGFDRHLVKDFLKAESKPKHLLSKLPWKLVPECQGGASEATVKVQFVPLRLVRVVVPQGPPDQATERPYATKVALQVLDASSQDTIYKVEAGALMNAEGPADSSATVAASDSTNPTLEQRDALYHAFWALVEDVGQLKRSPPKR